MPTDADGLAVQNKDVYSHLNVRMIRITGAYHGWLRKARSVAGVSGPC
jgi:hypothetical protein